MAECAICLEPIKSNRSVLQCGHVFHSACMKKMIKYNDTCPLCRKQVKLRYCCCLFLAPCKARRQSSTSSSA